MLPVYVAEAEPAMPVEHTYTLGLAKVFLFFFIMLGPLKVLGPYVAITHAIPEAERRGIPWKVAGIATLAVLVGGFVGARLMHNWAITPGVMEFAGAIVFFLVALRMVLAQYAEPLAASPAPVAATPLMRLVFPVVVTPYGVATVITLMAVSADGSRTVGILAMVILVMVLNLLTMLFAHAIMRWVTPLPLQVLGAVLGILQVALALQIMVGVLQEAGVARVV
jgi:multiple antibiotic resistance protein